MISADWSERLENLGSNPIARALALSLALHLLVFSTVELGYRLGLWNSSLFTILAFRDAAKPDPRSEAQKKGQTQDEQSVPMIFVEIDPSQATAEAPKEAKHYSSLNSLAGNPDTQLDLEVPKISGTQDKVPMTTDKSPSEPMPLQPAPQLAKATEAPPKEELEPKISLPKQSPPEIQRDSKVGDLAMARPTTRPEVTLTPTFSEAPESAPPREKPRRLADVRREREGLAGQKMMQEGGVRRYSFAEGLDAKATPFGAYDQLIIEAIRNHWYDLLDARDQARNETGRVVVTFRLNANGSVSHMRVAESTVGEILKIKCERAIKEPSPFPRWPSDMRRLVGGDYRDVRFTFYYD